MSEHDVILDLNPLLDYWRRDDVPDDFKVRFRLNARAISRYSPYQPRRQFELDDYDFEVWIEQRKSVGPYFVMPPEWVRMYTVYEDVIETMKAKIDEMLIGYKEQKGWVL